MKTNLLASNDKIAFLVDQFWDTYDLDNSGSLDLLEAKNFIQEMICKIQPNLSVTDSNYEQIFSEIDIDGDGFLTKEETKQAI